ncbi:MAG: XdhC/CoxI family protein [Candidatus Poseidoniales archaeon]
MTAHVLQWVLSELASQRRVVMATVLNTSGSVPGKTGARLAMSSHEHTWVGTVGGAGLEHRVLQRCRELLGDASQPFAEVLTYGLNKGAKGYEVTPLDSLCGGRVSIAVEVMIPMPHVHIMGGGHCGEALATTLHGLGWDYSVHDTRKAYVSEDKFPHAVERSSASVADILEGETAVTLGRFSDIMLLGHDWAEDQERLLGLLQVLNQPGVDLDGKQHPRIGVIGSRSKWQAFEEAAREQGVPQALLDQVICPIGLNIGAQSPEEIAVAVAAQIMSLHKSVDPASATWRQA